MKFEIKLSLLKDYIKRITSSVPSVAGRIEFTGVLVTVLENSVVFEGRNDFMDTKIEETSLSDVKISEPGKILIKANILNEVVQKMEGDTVVFSSVDDSIVTINSADSNYQIRLLDHDNYQKANLLSELEEEVVVNSKDFIEGVQRVLFAGKHDHTKYIYRGIHFKVEDGFMTLTGCDGVRIASYKSKINSSISVNKIIPIVVARELVKILPSGDIKFYFSHNKGLVVAGTMVNQFQLIEGTFPTFDTYFNTEIYKSKLEVNREVIMNSIDRVALLTTNKQNSSNRIELVVETNKLVIEAKEQEMGSSEVQIKAEDFNYEGEPLSIVMSQLFIYEGLRYANSSKINIHFINNSSSILVVSQEDNFVYLISPMV